MTFNGKTHIFGDNIDTDVIIPARYLATSDPVKLAPHCMEDVDPNFAKVVQKGDIIVAGENFGCGSSREHAPIAIKGAGVSCVIASSFARIFYRNAINIGLCILEIKDAKDFFNAGDIAKIDIQSGIVLNETSGKQLNSVPFPPFILEIIQKGGLLCHLKQ